MNQIQMRTVEHVPLWMYFELHGFPLERARMQTNLKLIQNEFNVTK